MQRIPILLSIFLTLTFAGGAVGQSASLPALDNRTTQYGRAVTGLKSEVRHELVMLPYYGVFDWLEADLQPNGKIVLAGQVAHPTLKKDAEARIRKVEGVNEVVNDIEVLPLSNFDDELRTTLFRAIYRFDSPLFRYALQPAGPIHIIVKNGHVELKGVVASNQDSQLAYMAARQVSGAFDVKNELQVESNRPIS